MILQDPELTRLSFLASSICAKPSLWDRFLWIVTGTIRGSVFYNTKNSSDHPDFEDVVNGMWDAFATSQTVREAAEKLRAQGGARREAGGILLGAADLNYKWKELRLDPLG